MKKLSKAQMDELALRVDTPETHATAYCLREEGKVYREIGERFNLSTGRAFQLVAKTKEVLENMPTSNSRWQGLDDQSVLRLECYGYKSKEEVVKALLSKKLNPNNKLCLGYGDTYHERVCEWAGVDIKDTMLPIKEINDSIKLLTRYGYTVSKA